MRGDHVWKRKTPEGEKREVRAKHFGKRWTLRAKLSSEEEWTELTDPSLEDLEDLREVLFNKYHRHRVSWERVAEIDQMVQAKGGEALDPRRG